MFYELYLTKDKNFVCGQIKAFVSALRGKVTNDIQGWEQGSNMLVEQG